MSSGGYILVFEGLCMTYVWPKGKSTYRNKSI